MMNKDKAIEEAMASIENRIRHVYNQGFEDGYAKGKEQTEPAPFKAPALERDCEHCVHRKDKGCSSWDCEYERRQ